MRALRGNGLGGGCAGQVFLPAARHCKYSEENTKLQGFAGPTSPVKNGIG